MTRLSSPVQCYLYVAQSSWELEKPLFCSDSQATNISAKAPDITQGSTASLILEFKKVDCMIVCRRWELSTNSSKKYVSDSRPDLLPREVHA